MSFNLYRIPPDFQICAVHREAALIYDFKYEEFLQECPCCNRIKGKRKVSLCKGTKYLLSISEQIPLYFSFIKMIIFNLILMIITVGTQRMFSQIKIVKFNLTLPSYDPFSLQIGFVQSRSEIRFIIFLIFTILILLVRGYLKKLKYKVQAATDNISDRSVMLINVDPQVKIKDIFHHFRSDDIVDVMLTYKVKEHSKFLQRIYKLIKKYWMMKDKKKEKDAQILKEQIRLSREELHFIYSNIQNEENRLDYVFLTFKTQESRDHFLKIYSRNIFSKLFFKFFSCCSPTTIKGQHITVEQGPDPQDIDWINLQKGYWTKKVHRFACYYMSFAILIFGFLFQYVITTFPIQFFYSSIVKNLLLFIVNYFIITLLQYTTYNIQKHEINTNKVLSLIKKLTFFIFLNLSMSPLSLYLFYSFRNQSIDANDSPFDQLCFSVLIIGVSNIMKPLMQYLNFQRIVRHVNFQSQRKNYGSQMTQEEAHQAFQPIAFPLASFYAIFISSLFLTAFFLPCFQILLVLDVIACIFLFFVSKYMLLRVCKEPVGLNHKISILCQKMLTIAIPLYWIGQQIMYFFIIQHDFPDFKSYFIQLDAFQISQLIIIGLSFLVFPKILSKISHRLAENEQISKSLLQKADDNVNRLTYKQVNSMKKLQQQYKQFFNSIL